MLLTNIDKCLISPIQCSDEQVALVQQPFPFPCRYLGAPLSVTRVQRSVEQQLVDKVAGRIPTWKARLLNTAGRLSLTRATLSAIPVHVSITLLPVGVGFDVCLPLVRNGGRCWRQMQGFLAGRLLPEGLWGLAGPLGFANPWLRLAAALGMAEEAR